MAKTDPSAPAGIPAPGLIDRVAATIKGDALDVLTRMGAEDLLDLVIDEVIVPSLDAEGSPLDTKAKNWAKSFLASPEGKSVVGILLSAGFGTSAVDMIPGLPDWLRTWLKGPLADELRMQSTVNFTRAVRKAIKGPLKGLVSLMGGALMKLAADERFSRLSTGDAGIGVSPARDAETVNAPAGANRQ